MKDWRNLLKQKTKAIAKESVMDLVLNGNVDRTKAKVKAEAKEKFREKGHKLMERCEYVAPTDKVGTKDLKSEVTALAFEMLKGREYKLAWFLFNTGRKLIKTWL